MNDFAENFPIENEEIKKLIRISEKTKWVWFFILGVPASLFMVAQVYGLFIGIPSDSVFTGIFRFIYDNTLGALKEHSFIEVLRLVYIWGLLNILLYSVVAIISYFMIAMMDPPKENFSKINNIVSRLFLAIINGPAYACNLIAEKYFEKYFMYNRCNTFINKLKGMDETSLYLISLGSIISSYIDLKTNGITTLLTLKIRFLEVISIVLWGIHPFVEAIKLNIEKVVTEIPPDKQVKLIKNYTSYITRYNQAFFIFRKKQQSSS